MTAQSSACLSTPSRYERYKAIVESVQGHTQFQLQDIRATCPAERPAFVTRVVHELEHDGWLVCEQGGPGHGYRWNQRREPFVASRWLDEKMYGAQIRQSPEQERPRERLLAQGVEGLTDSELLAILIRTGRPGESAVMAGARVSRAFSDRLSQLPHAGQAELRQISSAVHTTAYCQIMAGIELGRRIADAGDEQRATRIRSSTDAVAYCRRRFARLAVDGHQEEFHIVCLDTKNQVIDTHCITVGTLDASLVHPREVFRAAIRDAAAAVILVHNHPSGDPQPSPEDQRVTRHLESAGELLGIEVLDHVVLGRTEAVSLREHNGPTGR